MQGCGAHYIIKVLILWEWQRCFLHLCTYYVQGDQKVCAPDDYNTIVRCTETLIILYMRARARACVCVCVYIYAGLFISPSGISELDCATTKTDMAERSVSIGRESLQVFFVLWVLAYFQVPPLGGSREEKWRSQ